MIFSENFTGLQRKYLEIKSGISYDSLLDYYGIIIENFIKFTAGIFMVFTSLFSHYLQKKFHVIYSLNFHVFYYGNFLLFTTEISRDL